MSSVRRSTPSYLAWLLPAWTLFFMCGILLGRSLSHWLPLLLPLALSLTAALLSHRWRRTCALLLAGASFGAVVGWHGYHPAMPAEGECTVQGTVVQEVALREDGQVQTVLSDVQAEGAPLPDAYWTYYLAEGEAPPEWLVPGAQLTMTTRIYHPSGQENAGGFNFQEYLLQRGVTIGLTGAKELCRIDAGFSLRGWLAELRHELSLSLMEVMGSEAGAYASAMLLGTRDFITEDDRAVFNDLGVAHILSVSGYHVGLLTAVMLFLLRPLPLSRRWQVFLEAAVLFFYCLLTGGNAPAMRAALFLLWREFSRQQHQQLLPVHLMCATAVLQLLFNPTLLTGASFQLTYGAMLGLLLVHPWLRRRFTFRSRWGNGLWNAFSASFAAQLGVLMPQLYWFGQLPLLSVALNMVVMALSSGLMLLYWLTLAALPVPGLREMLGAASAGVTAPLLSAVRVLAALDFSTLWTRQADALTLAGWLMLLWSMSPLLPGRLKRQRRRIISLGTLLVAAILIPLPEHSVTYTQFSVGNADAALLQDGGMTIMIDAGEDGREIAGHLHRKRQSVDMLILTHLHTDHAGGIRALLDEEIPVDVCCLPVDASVPIIDSELLPLLEELAATGTEFRTLRRGDVLPLPSGSLTVLWPVEDRASVLHDANDVCLVLQAEIGGVTMLLTGDLSGVYEQYAAVPADILKVAHHGSSTSTSAEFLQAIDPQILLLSNRDENRETRMTTLAGDTPLYSTGKHGGITVRFLGDGVYTVETVKD